jgi:serine/threonine protein kinase
MNMWRELQPGDPELIGPYRLRGVLGSGGMGRVFLGLSADGRQVAVKVIRADLAADSEFRARFRREIVVAQKVNSRFTAPVIDADLDGPAPWLATAYVTGPSLADAVAEHGPLPAASVRKLAAGLAEGLSAIHAAGVVHRDLKPANVLLAEDGPKVIDFGISLVDDASVLTRTGLVVGSPGFMSPEQAEGREVGPASDIFSLGAVLAFAATGERPFGTGSTPAVVYRVVHHPATVERVPAEMRPLIERCLVKDPALRPTARELLAETSADPLAVSPLSGPVTQTFIRVPTLADASRSATTVASPAAGAGVPGSGQPGRSEGRRPVRHLGWRLALASLIAGLAATSAGGVALTAFTHHSHSPGAHHSRSHTPRVRVTAPAASTARPSAVPTMTTTPTMTPTPTATATPIQTATPTATGTPVQTATPIQTGTPA